MMGADNVVAVCHLWRKMAKTGKCPSPLLFVLSGRERCGRDGWQKHAATAKGEIDERGETSVMALVFERIGKLLTKGEATSALKAAAKEYDAAESSIVEATMYAGAVCTHAKSHIIHGEFEAWKQSEGQEAFGKGGRTLEQAMQFWEFFGENRKNWPISLRDGQRRIADIKRKADGKAPAGKIKKALGELDKRSQQWATGQVSANSAVQMYQQLLTTFSRLLAYPAESPDDMPKDFAQLQSWVKDKAGEESALELERIWNLFTLHGKRLAKVRQDELLAEARRMDALATGQPVKPIQPPTQASGAPSEANGKPEPATEALPKPASPPGTHPDDDERHVGQVDPADDDTEANERRHIEWLAQIMADNQRLVDVIEGISPSHFDVMRVAVSDTPKTIKVKIAKGQRVLIVAD